MKRFQETSDNAHRNALHHRYYYCRAKQTSSEEHCNCSLNILPLHHNLRHACDSSPQSPHHRHVHLPPNPNNKQTINEALSDFRFTFSWRRVFPWIPMLSLAHRFSCYQLTNLQLQGSMLTMQLRSCTDNNVCVARYTSCAGNKICMIIYTTLTDWVEPYLFFFQILLTQTCVPRCPASCIRPHH
jgi:hypothetical protein